VGEIVFFIGIRAAQYAASLAKTFMNNKYLDRRNF
jgi:hypothetical protein